MTEQRGIRARASGKRANPWLALPMLVVALAAIAMTVVCIRMLVLNGWDATVWFPVPVVPWGSELFMMPVVIAGPLYVLAAAVFSWGTWSWLRPERSREWHLARHRRRRHPDPEG